MTVPASLSKWAHPPRSNTPRSSSSAPPGPCITPSTETCVVVVSFMTAATFSFVWSCSVGPGAAPDLIGGGTSVLRALAVALLESIVDLRHGPLLVDSGPPAWATDSYRTNGWASDP